MEYIRTLINKIDQIKFHENTHMPNKNLKDKLNTYMWIFFFNNTAVGAKLCAPSD